MNKQKIFYIILILTFILALGFFSGKTLAQTEKIVVLNFEGTISTMSVELLKEALTYAETANLPIVLLINTPGGNLDSTFEIIKLIENSKVPVVGFVYPTGATAWSAGTYILFSTHVAAMAPHTIIGSCQPVALSFEGSQPINDTKMINALTAFLVEKARMHGRNETVARLCVKENLNLNDEQAKKFGVVEVLASSLDDLKEKIDGLTVITALGECTIKSKDAEIVEWTPSLRVLILKTISEPMIALFLLMIGLYTLILGLTSPGVGGEIVGGILLVLGLIGVGMIKDVNVGALLLIAIGAALLIYELFTPGFGIIGGSGVVSTLIGSLLLFPRQWAISQEWLNMLYLASIIIPLVFGGFFTFAAYKIIKARRKPPFLRFFIGEEAEVVEEITPEKAGFVVYKGEYWKAKSDETIKPKQKVKIVGKDGPILIVKPKKEESLTIS